MDDPATTRLWVFVVTLACMAQVSDDTTKIVHTLFEGITKECPKAHIGEFLVALPTILTEFNINLPPVGSEAREKFLITVLQLMMNCPITFTSHISSAHALCFYDKAVTVSELMHFMPHPADRDRFGEQMEAECKELLGPNDKNIALTESECHHILLPRAATQRLTFPGLSSHAPH